MNEFETAKTLFVEGVHLLQANDLPAAETRFARSLQILPERVSTLNNLSAIKLKLGKFAEAEELARKAVALDDSSPEAWSNLGLALTASGRPQEALPACDRALHCNSGHAMGLLARALTLAQLKRFDEALVACEQALKVDPGRYETLYHKSVILKELGRLDEARQIYRKALDLRVAASPVYIGERSATQKAEALVVNHRPEIDPSFRSFEKLNRFCLNFPGQLADYLHEDFHFNYVFMGDVASPAARQRIPPPDFVINNHVNGEVLVSERKLEELTQFIESFQAPIVNHPAKAVPTLRDLSATLLDGIPGIRVPKTLRFSAARKRPDELAGEIEGQFNYPLITRRLTAQQGKGMNRVDSRRALMDILLVADRPDEFFVTQFVDSRRSQDRFFRKMRAAVVQSELFIVRVDYDIHWLIHGRKTEDRVAFYLEHPELLEQEKRICKDPDAEIGASAMKSLRAMRERIPLDVFGIDFDVDPDGCVVFYEANATMNLFSTARKEVSYPKEADDSLKLAFQRYFASLLEKAFSSRGKRQRTAAVQDLADGI
jgi:tetratricopeptide (TPR) repeat protein